MATAKNVVAFPGDEKASSVHGFAQRWGGEELFRELFGKGYVPVPSLFLQHYARLIPPLNSGEAMFVLQLMDFKWDAKHPFPGYKTIAKRMGVTDKMARTHAKNLETSKYLIRHMRVGRTNRFDLTPLFEALARSIAKNGKKTKSK
jgi:hypothetical protein